ncbi:MAG: DUF4785 domain-containing protein, partial [Legionellales bacterium]
MKITQLVLLSAFGLTQAQAFNVPNQPIKSYECERCSALSHETLTDKWEITNQSLNHTISNAQKSYSYQQQVTMKQLRAGVPISTLAPRAVVRITPLQSKSVPLLNLVTPTQKVVSLKEASSDYMQDGTLGNSELSLKHQTMLQLKPDLGFGTFIIQTKDTQAKDSERYSIHV